MSSRPDLRVDWCSYEAAKYAVMHWHYSKAMPAGKLVKIGAWEDGQFIGCVLFGRGAIYNIGKPFELDQDRVCELVRVALCTHESATSTIVARAIRMLSSHNPQLRLIVSYADSKEGHLGIIYQATNWAYVGAIDYRAYYMLGGIAKHGRSVYAKYGTQSLSWLRANVDPNAHMEMNPPKHKYLYPLDRAMRHQIEPLAQPYPKREHASEAK